LTVPPTLDPRADAARIRLRVLGSLRIEGASADGSNPPDLVAQPKNLALLVYLVLARPHGFHRRDRLVGLLWGDLDQDHARGSLRKALQRLRQTLGPDVVVSEGAESLVVPKAAVECDAVAFYDALDTGALRQALDLYTGDLLPGFFVPGAADFEDWLEQERANARERVVQAAWKLVERFANDRELTNASQLARRVARLAPTDERMLRRVLTMLARLGDRAGAVEVYRKFAARLQSEYQTTPSRETDDLLAAIQRGDAV
jgi:DNA-binding SARP family transcriptional activator